MRISDWSSDVCSSDLLLPAGSVALAGPDGVVVRTGTIDEARQALSWRDGFLAFRDTSLADAAAEFNRYNARRIVIADPSVGALRVGGHFRWSNSEGFVRLLAQGFPVRAEYGDAELVLPARCSAAGTFRRPETGRAACREKV